MSDVFSPEKRSKVMSRIRSVDTAPEITVRRALHHIGYRYRLHDKKLPGKPDVVLPKYRTVVQVRGCFWHGHGCKRSFTPKSRKHYWLPKLRMNKSRDRRNDRDLRRMGWRVLVVWECRCTTERGLKNEVRRISSAFSNMPTTSLLRRRL